MIKIIKSLLIKLYAKHREKHSDILNINPQVVKKRNEYNQYNS